MLFRSPSGVLPCGTTLSHTESGVSAFATVGVLWVVNPVHGLAEGSIFPVLQDKEPFTFERLEEIRRNGLIGLIVEASFEATQRSMREHDNLSLD